MRGSTKGGGGLNEASKDVVDINIAVGHIALELRFESLQHWFEAFIVLDCHLVFFLIALFIFYPIPL